ncbi:aminotransferase class V-fold PLP-dependent enzyme [Flammeovirga yaeyamensis]|uniref:aminotransferase class V-fold PLP-dependent enzyme n=1 Tax=Flammeovirga yaeyamensis TaxID=367791 RepID=UPI00146E744B|nr:cysteine desulfurase [Flammeovirga yaeyamensis]MBB3701222.1 cysteine desulfurase/selenocysteine lyase [Flammeovirga yaeyamensis]NMF38452.1 cysteine desulfurase [Flammeovirga yaeyamensis]
MIDIEQLRSEFPILATEVNGHPLTYFDNGATNQKPQSVIDALSGYYKGYNSNVHRGAHALADKATQAFEHTRELLKEFVNAPKTEQIIFTKGTTEGINLVANTYGRANLQAGDEVIVSTMEHHSNIVPWQIVAQEKGATVRNIPISDEGEIIFEEFEKMLSDKVKIVSIVHASNALGTVNPVERIIEKAHEIGAVVLIDGAQSAAHLPIDVQALNCDFFVTSAHKMFGPTGMGFLYGKEDILNDMPPFMGGGEMIKEVSFDGTTFNTLPYKFEAGTPNIADTVAYAKAIEFINRYGKENIAAREKELLDYATKKLIEEVPTAKIIGTSSNKVSVLSFIIENIHNYDIGMMLDARGIAVRTGHHCTQPLMARYGLEGTVRASFSVYNTFEEIDNFIEALKRIVKMFG